jgi:arsenate reductase (thioredoxin)
MGEPIRVLILCTGNSARSQMAEGILREQGRGRFAVESAGTHPTALNSLAVEAMREIGIDISSQHSKSVEEFAGQAFDYVITVCDRANEECPFFPEKTRRIHWGFDDPAAAEGSPEERLAVFRTVRDKIRQRLAEFALAPLLAIGADQVS